MENLENDAMYQKYPRLYPLAQAYGIDDEVLDNLFAKIEADPYCKVLYKTHASKEVGLREVLFRLKWFYPNWEVLDTLHLLKPYKLYFSSGGYEKLSRLSGKRNFEILLALLN